jgi:hypothetical protein
MTSLVILSLMTLCMSPAAAAPAVEQSSTPSALNSDGLGATSAQSNGLSSHTQLGGHGAIAEDRYACFIMNNPTETGVINWQGDC